MLEVYREPQSINLVRRTNLVVRHGQQDSFYRKLVVLVVIVQRRMCDSCTAVEAVTTYVLALRLTLSLKLAKIIVKINPKQLLYLCVTATLLATDLLKENLKFVLMYYFVYTKKTAKQKLIYYQPN